MRRRASKDDGDIVVTGIAWLYRLLCLAAIGWIGTLVHGLLRAYLPQWTAVLGAVVAVSLLLVYFVTLAFDGMECGCVIFIVALLLAILVPVIVAVRHRANGAGHHTSRPSTTTVVRKALQFAV